MQFGPASLIFLFDSLLTRVFLIMLSSVVSKKSNISWNVAEDTHGSLVFFLRD